MKRLSGGILLITLFVKISVAQVSAPGPYIICYSSPGATEAKVGNKVSPLAVTSLTKTASFQITYTDVPMAVQAPIAYAVSIWETAIHSDIEIHLNVKWSSLTGSTLAVTRPTSVYRDFGGDAVPGVWYPVALAEKIAVNDLNSIDENDIEITVNSGAAWYTATDGNTPVGKIDMVSVILHEIAHGLGFSSSATISGSDGTLRIEKYITIFDLILENKKRTRLSTYADPSTDLRSQFTSQNIFIYSPSCMAAGGELPRIFAPFSFVSASSMAHLDEASYPEGNPDALMTPYLAGNEVEHSLGTILPNVLNDMGWGDQPLNTKKVDVYPNPGSDLFTVQIAMPLTTNAVSIMLSDVSGHLLMQGTNYLQFPYQELDLSDFPNGLYLLKVTGAGTTLVNKIVVAH